MLEIQYNDTNKYKILREISSNYAARNIKLFCSAPLQAEDIDRYIFYHWHQRNNFYYALTELSKIQLSNFYNFKDFFKGICIQCEINDNIKSVIQKYCEENGKELIYEF